MHSRLINPRKSVEVVFDGELFYNLLLYKTFWRWWPEDWCCPCACEWCYKYIANYILNLLIPRGPKYATLKAPNTPSDQAIISTRSPALSRNIWKSAVGGELIATGTWLRRECLCPSYKRQGDPDHNPHSHCTQGPHAKQTLGLRIVLNLKISGYF